MVIKIKSRKNKLRYTIDITTEDISNAEFSEKELDMLKRKNRSKKISDIIYGIQIQARCIEKAKEYKATIKRNWQGKVK